ncbi:MAG: type II toxin-antitoxin system VapC family toxin [Thiobacillaceae bacterium]|nr:type II toxin-antitoxin system VapC family toxin [Thiobacillaceae bacterium]
MTTQYVLDASAVLAWLWRETGAKTVEDLLAAGGCAMSSVNLAEVLTKALDKGLPPEQLRTLVGSLELEVLPFEIDDAVEAARLRVPTRHLGLSLADRACLALAKTRGHPAVTADQAWVVAGPAIGVQIICIRSQGGSA